MAFAAEVWSALTLEARVRLQAYMPLASMNGKKAQTALRGLLTEAIRDGELVDPVSEVQFANWFNKKFALQVPEWVRVEYIRDTESQQFGLPLIATCTCGKHEVSLVGFGTMNNAPVQGFLVRGTAMQFFCTTCRSVASHGGKFGRFLSFYEAEAKLTEQALELKRQRKMAKHPFLKERAFA